jgi:pimeloyl-ACP methyl ester carboxylesterase
MRRIGKVLLWLVVVLLVLAVAGAIYQAIATELAERAYPPPGEMVDVGGYSLHIDCVGQGSPTVLLDAGSGLFSAQWVRVQRQVSSTTRVCAYDRAGMGWSEMGPEPRDAMRITGELHTLLGKAGIEGPYVLVGHSFGGMYMQTYAARYPKEVAGVALVDYSTDPDQFGQRPQARDSHEPQKQTSAVVSQLVRFGVSLPARLGIVRLLSKLDPASPDLPQKQRAQTDALTPSTREFATSVLEFLAPTQTLRLGSPGSLGDKPLAVITAPKLAEPGWLKHQDELAALSSNSIHRVVKGATHTSLLYEKRDSQATSAAVVEVVEAVRRGQPLTRKGPNPASIRGSDQSPPKSVSPSPRFGSAREKYRSASSPAFLPSWEGVSAMAVGRSSTKRRSHLLSKSPRRA